MIKYIIILILISGSAQYIQSQTNDGDKLKWYTIKEVSELQKKEPRKILLDM